MAVYTYDPSKVEIRLAGYRLTGIVAISVERESPTFKVVKGLKGTSARVRNPDTGVTVTLTIQQQSNSNSLLSQIHRDDIQYGTGRLELVVADLGGETVIDSDEAFVESYANVDFQEEAGTRSWILRCLSTRSVKVGGNFKPAIDLF